MRFVNRQLTLRTHRCRDFCHFRKFGRVFGQSALRYTKYNLDKGDGEWKLGFWNHSRRQQHSRIVEINDVKCKKNSLKRRTDEWWRSSFQFSFLWSPRKDTDLLLQKVWEWITTKRKHLEDDSLIWLLMTSQWIREKEKHLLWDDRLIHFNSLECLTRWRPSSAISRKLRSAVHDTLRL